MARAFAERRRDCKPVTGNGSHTTPKHAAKARRRAVAVGEVAAKLLSPLIARRAGMTSQLLAAWSELVGEHGAHSRPEKILWPRRAGADEEFVPGTLVIACDGAQAVWLQHETGQIIERINRFFGFAAIEPRSHRPEAAAGRSAAPKAASRTRSRTSRRRLRDGACQHRRTGTARTPAQTRRGGVFAFEAPNSGPVPARLLIDAGNGEFIAPPCPAISPIVGETRYLNSFAEHCRWIVVPC